MVEVDFSKGDGILENLSSALKVIYEMEKIFLEGAKISLDFSSVTWFIPGPMILISNKIKELTERGADIEIISPKKAEVQTHMNKIGFPMGGKDDGDSYISIKHFKRNDVDKNQVNREANDLVNKIENRIPDKFGGSVQYIVAEMSDNIDAHSEFSYASLMAQYFPSKQIIDIAICDNGVTIPGLFEKHGISFRSDEEAIKKAIEGKTTKNEEMRGYGLQSCKRLSTEMGELCIVSRSGVLILKPNTEPFFYHLEGEKFNGTFLYFRLKVPDKMLDIHKFVE